MKIHKNLKPVISAVCLLLAAILSFGYYLLNPVENSAEGNVSYYDYPFYVCFIDVGQGDCELISCNGVNILVDGGEAKYAGRVLNYLDSLGIEKLDCYIATHPHSDHIGASASILSQIPCDNVFTTYFSEHNIPTSNTYESFLDAVYDSGATAVAVEAGDEYKFGELTLKIFAPVTESDEYNDMSIVFSAEYKNASVLFTGDATKTVEKQILSQGYDVSADAIKIAHHGSTSSNSEEFIEAVAPESAVISCGKDNSYGHPHREIINLLTLEEIEYYRTDISGTIVYYSDGVSFNQEVAE